MSAELPEIEPSTLKARLDAGEALVLVDVREAYERAICDLPSVGQLCIPLGELADRVAEVPRDRVVVVYCRSGGRSESVVHFLRAQGYERVFNLCGGVLGWQEEVDPTLTRY